MLPFINERILSLKNNSICARQKYDKILYYTLLITSWGIFSYCVHGRNYFCMTEITQAAIFTVKNLLDIIVFLTQERFIVIE